MQSVFAWVAADVTGNVGILSVTTPLGIAPAVFAKRSLAESFRDQAQARADMLSVDVELIEFSHPTTLETIHSRNN